MSDLARHWQRADELAEPRDRKTMQVDDVDRMWALLQEAAQTSRWFSAPPRTGYPSQSAMPDSPDEISHWQAMLAYLRGEVDEPPEMDERSIQPRPDPQAITRCDWVLKLFHTYALNGRRNKMHGRKALWAYAAGAKAIKVRRKFGLSRYQMQRIKSDAMDDMLRAAQ